jgi:hypothetical protein
MKRIISFVMMIALSATAFAIEEWCIQKPQSVRIIQGTVKYPDLSPASGVVVELYDNLDVVLHRDPGWEGKQHKIASTTTDQNGRLKFKKVRPGKYEVRALLDHQTGANQTSIIVRVRRFWFWPLGRALKVRYCSFI